MWWNDLHFTDYYLAGDCQYCADKSLIIQLQAQIVERECNPII